MPPPTFSSFLPIHRSSAPAPAIFELRARNKQLVSHRNTASTMSSAPKPPKDHFNVLYFAGAAAHTGKDYEALPAPLALGKLFGELESRHAGIEAKILTSCLVTVNLEYVDVPGDGSDSGVVIAEGDEVAIIPPVSSG